MNKIYWVLSAIILFAVSCQQPENVGMSGETVKNEEVKPEVAIKVAKNFNAFVSVLNDQKTGARNARTSQREKTVKKTTPFKDGKGSPAFYVITYNEGGFVIISAEKKMMPIIAFSETNDFPVDNLPTGVKETIGQYQEMIGKIRATALPEDPKVAYEWRRFENTSLEVLLKSGARTMSEPTDPPCEDSQVYYGPLITTNWGQGCGYNADMPDLRPTCPSMPCNRALTGCVATAMAQVMNFHAFPNTFAWGSMGAWQPQTQLLMRTNANNVSMTYDCGGSGAYPSAIPNAFVISYGYSSAYHGSFNSSTIMTERDTYNRPVILSGWSSSGTNGHTWVCDGYFMTYNCTNGWSAPMFHMNWGWEGSSNGFYSSYTPSGFDFNYSKQMEYGIHP